MAESTAFADGPNHLDFLTGEEAREIREQFRSIPNTAGKLVFWTGLPREWAQLWADEHQMLTLTTMMGPLMDPSSPRCPRAQKKPKAWSKYVKGASILFAAAACETGAVVVLTVCPYDRREARPGATYFNIEQPILHGAYSNLAAERIFCVHPAIIGAENVLYEIWPTDRSNSWKRMYGPDCQRRTHLPRRKKIVVNALSQACGSMKTRRDQTPKALVNTGQVVASSAEVEKRARGNVRQNCCANTAEDESKTKKAEHKVGKKAGKETGKGTKEIAQKKVEKADKKVRKAKAKARKKAKKEAKKKAKTARKVPG